MAEVGEPFAFCGRIVEAYYSNPELDTVAIMWSDGEKNREYYVVVDEEDDQFQALLKEWSYESLDECTRGRNEQTRQEFRDAFQRYATEQGLYGFGDKSKQIKVVTEFVEVEIDSVKEVEKFVIEEVETETIKEVEKAVTRQPRIINVEYLLFNYNPEINQHREELFKLKLKMFEEDIVKNSKAKIKKTAIRKATTPAEAISAYHTFIK